MYALLNPTLGALGRRAQGLEMQRSIQQPGLEAPEPSPKPAAVAGRRPRRRGAPPAGGSGSRGTGRWSCSGSAWPAIARCPAGLAQLPYPVPGPLKALLEPAPSRLSRLLGRPSLRQQQRLQGRAVEEAAEAARQGAQGPGLGGQEEVIHDGLPHLARTFGDPLPMS